MLIQSWRLEHRLIKRFTKMEEIASKDHLKLEEMDVDQLELLWQNAKKDLSRQL